MVRPAQVCNYLFCFALDDIIQKNTSGQRSLQRKSESGERSRPHVPEDAAKAEKPKARDPLRPFWHP